MDLNCKVYNIINMQQAIVYGCRDHWVTRLRQTCHKSQSVTIQVVLQACKQAVIELFTTCDNIDASLLQDTLLEIPHTKILEL